MMGWYDDGLGSGGWVVMLISMVAFWGLVVWGVVALFRDNQSNGARSAHYDPLTTLDERFARGEIDETEYQSRAETLRAAHR